VKFLGINVGSIADISIDPDDVNTIIVELELQENTPVKKDAVADIVAMGITGLKTIEIRGGTQDAEFMQPGEFIQQGTSLQEDITGKAEVIAFKVEQVLNNLQEFTEPSNMTAFRETAEQISSFAEQASYTIASLDEIINENRHDIRQTLTSVNKISEDLEKTSDELFFAVSRFNYIMQGDTINEILGNFRDISLTLRETNLNELIESLARATEQTQNLLLKVSDDIDTGTENLAENLFLLEETLINLNEASRKISSNPSSLVRRPRIDDAADKMLEGD
jgi:phospholipid/cholesterol/gamma-HCH transport system substrate-binding protein